MGLGLTYCRRAVETQGGSIDFESNVGAGTNFTIKLPLDPNIPV
jgi:signal transduction histidine kinase